MARSRLSIHAIPVHDPDAVIRFAHDLQPPLILIVDPDVNFVSRCYQQSPNSLFSLRNHPLSEQKQDVYRDPAGTGERHAREMVEWCDKMYAQAADRNLPMPPLEQVILPGMNEPLVNSDDEIKAVVTYNVHYLDGLRARSRRGSGLEFSVGWPRNSAPGAPAEWEAWRPVYEAIKRGRHYASLHEYWPNEGPSMWAGWLCYRLVTWIPDYWADVPFIITECGLDDAAIPGRPHKFWKDFFLRNPQIYVNQYAEYERNMRSIRNQHGVQITILGYCVFTDDYGGSEWEGADIKSITNLFLSFVSTADMPDIPDLSHLYLPTLGNGGVPTVPRPPVVEPSPGVIPSLPPVDLFDWALKSMCRIFSYDLKLVRALINVESDGRPFVGGKPIIRFESHIMLNKMANKQLWHEHFRADLARPWTKQEWRRSPADPWKQIHTGDQANEWQVFEFAKTLDSRAAHLSLAMGAGQMMGFNYGVPNYASPEEMLAAFSDPNWGAVNQLTGIFAYLYKVDGLSDAVAVGDLPTIALKYNGPGQVDYYVKRFQEELAKLQ